MCANAEAPVLWKGTHPPPHHHPPVPLPPPRHCPGTFLGHKRPGDSYVFRIPNDIRGTRDGCRCPRSPLPSPGGSRALFPPVNHTGIFPSSDLSVSMSPSHYIIGINQSSHPNLKACMTHIKWIYLACHRPTVGFEFHADIYVLP